jgi:hypothetical protein
VPVVFKALFRHVTPPAMVLPVCREVAGGA